MPELGGRGGGEVIWAMPKRNRFLLWEVFPNSKQKPFLSGIAKNGRQKQRLACITEPSNDDYDNHVSDSCDHNFDTFDDFGVKNDQKLSNNMILMSKYKGKHGGKKGPKNLGMGRPPPHHLGNARKKTFFFN